MKPFFNSFSHGASKKLFLTSLSLILIGGGIFWFTEMAQGVNRTWDGGGVDGTCGGVGTANNWSCAANWSGDTAPTASDVAIFDATSTKNATINSAISVAGISINAGYTGTITQSSTFTVTVGGSHYSQAAGTFTGGSGTIDINGTYTLSGGTFTSTTGTLEIGYDAGAHTTFLNSAGTFNHNSGTIRFISGDSGNTRTYTVDVSTSVTFYDFEWASIDNVNPDVLTTGTSDTVIIANDATLSGGQLLGTWEVQGDVVVNSGADGGQGTLTYTGTGTKRYTHVSGGKGPHLQVNNASVNVVAADGVTSLNVMLFSLLAGTFTAPTGIFEFRGDFAGGTVFTQSSGTTYNHNNGTAQFTYGDSGNTRTYTIDVPTQVNFYHCIWNSTDNTNPDRLAVAAGDTVVIEGDLTHTNGVFLDVWEVQGNYTIGSGADGGSATFSFTGGNNQTYTDQGGNEPDGDITVNKSGGTVILASNADWNAASQDLTITAGTLFAPDKSIATTALTIGASGILSMMGSQTLTLGGALANSGTVKIWGSGVCDGGDNALIRSSSNGVQRSWNGAGTFTLYDVDVRDMAGSAAITLYSSTNTANNGANWTFSGAACPAQPPATGLSTGKMNLQSGKMNLR